MNQQSKHNFRNSISTINNEGKRAWIYPKKPIGKWYQYRKHVSYVLLVILFTAPFIKVNGNQLFLFNVIERRFNVFGVTFWPQDFHLFVILMIIGIVFVILFTTIFGRLFCGWMCPQTIFMEMVFRRIEYWIEGDRGKQIRLSKMPWNKEKIIKKSIKWFVFYGISFIIANIFLAYLIGSDNVIKYISSSPLAHLKTLITLCIFTTVFFIVFAWFREQVCVIACPYGRLQGVLLDNDSVLVAYNHLRGEQKTGRAKFKKNENRSELGKGDCIDCNQCVLVCPTGIDIRNGTQLECINCTACMDACDQIMEAVNLPKGLIKYSSEHMISKKQTFRFTARMKAYTVLLFVLLGIGSIMLFLRNDIEASLLRIPGQLYERTTTDSIRNVFTYKLVNKTNNTVENISFKIISLNGTIKPVGEQSINIKRQQIKKGTLFIDLPTRILEDDKVKLTIGVFSNNKRIKTTKTTFLGPRKFNN